MSFNPLIGILFLHAEQRGLAQRGLIRFNPLIGILFLHALSRRCRHAAHSPFQSPNRDSVSSRKEIADFSASQGGFNPLIGILFLHAGGVCAGGGNPERFNPLIGILFLHAGD